MAPSGGGGHRRRVGAQLDAVPCVDGAAAGVYIYMHTHVYAYAWERNWMQFHAWMARLQVCTYTHVCMLLRGVQVHVQPCAYMRMHVCMSMCLHARMLACMSPRAHDAGAFCLSVCLSFCRRPAAPGCSPRRRSGCTTRSRGSSRSTGTRCGSEWGEPRDKGVVN